MSWRKVWIECRGNAWRGFVAGMLECGYLAETFFERAAGDKITVEQVARAMKQVSFRTGIENDGRITNENVGDMPTVRNAFIDKLVNEVEAAVHKIKASGAEDDAIKYWRVVERATEEANAGHSDRMVTARDEQDSFAPYFEVWKNRPCFFFGNGESGSGNGAPNSNAKARGILLKKQSDGHTLLAIQGMPVVGKT